MGWIIQYFYHDAILNYNGSWKRYSFTRKLPNHNKFFFIRILIAFHIATCLFSDSVV